MAAKLAHNKIDGPKDTMRQATELLSQYATYHRDRRNIATHFIGVPMLVFAVGVLLARPAFSVGDWSLTPAMLAWVMSTLWYLSRGNLVLALAVSAANGVLIALGHAVAQQGDAAWWAGGVGGFIVGWAIQFVGHHYEGRKPAFADDLVGLLVGPMFVTAEAMFALGWDRPLHAKIEAHAGPTLIREMPRAPIKP